MRSGHALLHQSQTAVTMLLCFQYYFVLLLMHRTAVLVLRSVLSWGGCCSCGTGYRMFAGKQVCWLAGQQVCWLAAKQVCWLHLSCQGGAAVCSCGLQIGPVVSARATGMACIHHMHASDMSSNLMQTERGVHRVAHQQFGWCARERFWLVLLSAGC